jgi:hypothetical protein
MKTETLGKRANQSADQSNKRSRSRSLGKRMADA